jgi:hypothetical protein
LRHDAIVAWYDEVRLAFAKCAANSRQRERSAIPVDATNAGYVGQGMARGTDSVYVAAISEQRCRQSSRQGPPFSGHYQH